MMTQKSYLPSYLNNIVNLLNVTHRFDRFNADLVREKIEADPDYDPDLIPTVWEGEELIAFMHGVVRDVGERKIAYIKFMAVHNNQQRSGLGRDLYVQLEQKFIAQGATTVRFFDVPLNYYMPGIDPRYTKAVCFAEKMGFKRFGDSFNMEVDLKNTHLETDETEALLRARNITVQRATKSDKAQLLSFIKTHFTLWHHEIKNMYQQHPIAIHIARENGTLIAFSGHSGNNMDRAWFGPMGTDPEKRGRGVGAVLLKRCLHDLRLKGFDTATIPWVAPIAFYAHHVNAEIERLFWRYEKQIS